MILCATGHRPDKLGGYKFETMNRLLILAELYLMNNTPDSVISGMAQGWDLAWAAVAQRLGIPVCAAIPCDNQEARWPERAQRNYRTILSRCRDRVIVSPGPYESWKMFKRNEWMVDNSDGCVALWNGDHSGGTCETVKYVERRQQARPDYTFVNLWPEWEKLNA